MSASIKICGLSTEESVDTAAACGADYVGFVHFPRSPRHISPARAGELKKRLPAAVKSVCVMVDPDDVLLEDVMGMVAPDFVQLHGKESPARLAAIKARYPGLGIIKAITVSSAADIAAASAHHDVADMLLFDASPPKGAQLPGGNGVVFEWSLLRDAQVSLPWLLSGGLDADNVGAALRASGAKGVDVSSGVESSAGVKDLQKIESFIQAVQRYESES